MSKVEWPQLLTIYVHEQCDDGDEGMDAWLEERGVDPRSEAGRLIANAAYEHKMEYLAWPDGRTRLVKVDDVAFQDPIRRDQRAVVCFQLGEAIDGHGSLLKGCKDDEERAVAKVELKRILSLIEGLG